MGSDDDDVASKPVFTGPKFNMPKKYGLIIPNKAGAKPIDGVAKKPVKPCIFDEDEDMEEETKTPKGFDSMKLAAVKAKTSNNKLKKQTQIEIEKALMEDPSVFEYDNVYDEMEKERVKIDPSLKKNESKEPKYIAGIMKAAAKRQMEFEKLQERKIHKERQEEGDLWKDKEVFVTSAYRKKMEERAKIEEEEKNQDKIEELLDVRKAKDLSGFYSNMLKMRAGEFVMEEEGAKEKRLEQERKQELEIKKRSESEKQKKSYRSKRESSDEEEEKKEEAKVKGEKPMDTADIDKDNLADAKEPTVDIKAKLNDKQKEIEEPDSKKVKLEPKPEETDTKEKAPESPEKLKISKEEKRRLMFDKRTVGAKLDEELSDYFIRKSSTLSLKNYIEREN